MGGIRSEARECGGLFDDGARDFGPKGLGSVPEEWHRGPEEPGEIGLTPLPYDSALSRCSSPPERLGLGGPPAQNPATRP